MRNKVIYKSRNGDPYYEDDLKEDRYGNLYLYDEYERKDVYFDDESRRRYNSHAESSNRTSRANKYDVSPSSIKEDLIGEKVVTNKKVHSYENLPVMRYDDKNINSNKGFFNTILESKNATPGTHIIALYPNTSLSKHKEAIGSMLKYTEELVLKPDLVYTETLTEEEDLLFSSLITSSFRGIRMEDAGNNLPGLMKYKGQSDPGWTTYINRLGKALKGNIETNLFILPKEFLAPLGNASGGTEEFDLPEELKSKINAPFGGYVMVDNLVFSITYTKARLFMVVP